ncbi:MAG: AmmeMemoRadiSam system radical SAM enzyme [Fusobacteriaceae bacterium]|nr:AmmeMemoRadiSam system radical SAM enzyme [Fusobacteriaceae bacterium]
MTAVCALCPKSCRLEEGQTGFCRGRKNEKGRIVSENYGHLTSIALDPVEKKPLYHFYPGNRILSVGSYGCNFRCPFCQNHTIAQADGHHAPWRYVGPEELTAEAVRLIPSGNIGIAFTYNEPLICPEYIKDCARLAKNYHLKTVLVTNGSVNEPALRELLPFVDAMNIDLKGFTEEFYKSVGGTLETVKNTITLSRPHAHIELTKLVVPRMNDTDEDMENMARWIRSVHEEIPLHVSRFFPCYKMADARPTPVQTVYRQAEIARKYLRYVYTGNC